MKTKKRVPIVAIIALTTVMLASCGEGNGNNTATSHSVNNSSTGQGSTASGTQGGVQNELQSQENSKGESEGQGSSQEESLEQSSATEIYVRFGDNGEAYTMHLYDNDTAAAIARHVGTAEWRIPLYNYDGYDNWEIMQYYDIPSRYEIPSSPQEVTSQEVGAVYYSEPNRIVLFYGEGQVSAQYTPVGFFDVTPDFIAAVENNPVLEGWNNKIIKIAAEK